MKKKRQKSKPWYNREYRTLKKEIKNRGRKTKDQNGKCARIERLLQIKQI